MPHWVPARDSNPANFHAQQKQWFRTGESWLPGSLPPPFNIEFINEILNPVLRSPNSSTKVAPLARTFDCYGGKGSVHRPLLAKLGSVRLIQRISNSPARPYLKGLLQVTEREHGQTDHSNDPNH
jgi:hypothetical protein